MDQRARRVDGKAPHPIGQQILDRLHATEWVEDAAVRLRDQGQVFHVEVFVRPKDGNISLTQLDELSTEVCAVDWKVQDVVIVPTDLLPDYADRGKTGAAGAPTRKGSTDGPASRGHPTGATP